MVDYCNSYLEKYYDNFIFFDSECSDKRIRETNIRIKKCLRCPGRQQCGMHPDFWLEGEFERMKENTRLKESELKEEAAQS